jgi:hypothetical protein
MGSFDLMLTAMIVSSLFGFVLGKGYGPALLQMAIVPFRFMKKKF